MDCGFHVACVWVSRLSRERRAFNVCFSETRVCTVGLGKAFRISFQAGLLLFFPIDPIDNHEPVQPAAKRGTSTRDGLIERLATFPHFISRRGSRSRIFIADRALRVSFLSRVSHLYDEISQYFTRLFFPPLVRHEC